MLPRIRSFTALLLAAAAPESSPLFPILGHLWRGLGLVRVVAVGIVRRYAPTLGGDQGSKLKEHGFIVYDYENRDSGPLGFATCTSTWSTTMDFPLSIRFIETWSTTMDFPLSIRYTEELVKTCILNLQGGT